SFNTTADRDADGSGLLGNNHGDRVGFFRNSDRGAMARAKLCGKYRIHGQGQKASSGGNAVLLQDDSSVVQRGARAKDGGQQIVGNARIQRNSAFDVSTQSDLALDYDQRASLVLRKQIRGQHNVIVNVRFAGG